MKKKEPEPEYCARVREMSKQPGLPRISVERSILRGWKAEWSQQGNSPWDHTFTHHMLEYIRLLLPKVDHHKFFVDMVRAFEETYFVKGLQICNVIGSQNSGKTDFFATFGNAIISIWPEYTTVKVAAPYKTAAESTIWGRMLTKFDQVKKANPEMWKLTYSTKKGKIVYYDGPEGVGQIELVTVDKVGKLQGMKSADKTKGFIIIFCDEIALFQQRDILEILDNVRGNTNFFLWDGCNFKNTEGLEGDLCRPKGKEYSDLDIDRDLEWYSAYASYTIRLDGYQSPNILANKVIYNYLLKPADVKRMRDIHGENGPKFKEQVRSFPSTSVSEFYVLTRAKVKQAAAYDDLYEMTGQRTRVAYCDLGFGGDPCKIGAFEFGEGRVQTLDGGFAKMQLFMPLAAFSTIPVDEGMIADREFLAKLRHHCGDPDYVMREGNEVSKEQQIAVACGDFLDRWNIPRQGFGFDPSFRSEAPQEMFAILGTRIQALGFEGNATERIVRYDRREQKEGPPLRVPVRAKEDYSNFVTEVHFAFATLVQSGQFRGADMVPAAIAQICRRWWQFQGTRKKIQSKYGKSKDDKETKSYKAEHGRSPDDGDTLVGGFEMARRNGFTTEEDRRPAGRGATNNLNRISEIVRSGKRFNPGAAKSLSRR